MAICARCDLICTSDSGTSSSRRKMVKMMMASAPATPAGTAPSSGVATNSSPCMSGWTRSAFHRGSRVFTDQVSPRSGAATGSGVDRWFGCTGVWRTLEVRPTYVLDTHGFSAAFLWHRVVTAATPWLAAGQPLRGEPAAAKNAVPLEGDVRIVRTGRFVTASRRQRWPDRRLIHRDQGHQPAARPCHQVWDVRT